MSGAAWPNRRAQLTRLLGHFAGRSPVLDLGSGPGLLLTLLRDRNEHGEGVEYLRGPAAAARAAGHRIHRADVLAFLRRAPKGKYGAVCMSHIIEHLPPREVLGALRRVCHTLKPGGRLVILTPNPRNIGVMTRTFWGDIEHTRPYVVHLLVGLLGDAGFSIVRAGDDPYTRQPGWLHRPLTWMRRLIVGDFWQGADLLVIADKP